MLPNCSHYIAQDLAVGRYSICNRCDNIFQLTVKSVKQLKPHCDDCTRKDIGFRSSKIDISTDDLAAFLAEHSPDEELE